MKKVVMLLALGLTISLTPAMSEEIVSLRGPIDLNMASSEAKNHRFLKDSEPFLREYIQQPPLIPHQIRDYQVDLNTNKCLTCHSWKNYRKSGATKISQTHFQDRDINVLANVSPRRYFCNQCHVPQANVKPLVENNFKPVLAVSED